jgi:hypothetical protein
VTTRFGKDLAATGFTALIVLTFFATHEHWNVWLASDSRRWAAGFITLFGVLSCALGETTGRMSKLLAGLGIVAVALAIVAIATGSLTALSLLVVDDVALWALSTARHYSPEFHAPVSH